jgi:hypothetical protein
MDITLTAKDSSAGRANMASGTLTSDNTAVAVKLGFKPRWVKVVNETDVIIWETLGTMASTKAIKVVTAGTTTVDTGSAIVIGEDGFTISATAAGNSKVLHWAAMD